MDKLKPIWKVIKKYHVWVFSVIVIATGLGALFAAGNGLGTDANKTAKDVEAMDKKVQNLVSLVGNRRPPNETWIKQVEEEGGQVRDIWQQIYDWQEQKLKWPEDVGGIAGADFAASIRKQAGEDRIEKVQEEAFEAYAAQAFDQLLAIVKAQPDYTDETQEVDDGARRPDKKKTAVTYLPLVRSPYVIGWVSQSQRRIRDPLVDWGNEPIYRAPTTARAERTQRDLWIYGSMLSAIAKTNGKATENYMAKVKHILDLRVGADRRILRPYL